MVSSSSFFSFFLQQELPAREDIRLDMIMVPGDIQFLHNHQIVHARTAYEDFEEEDQKRHLLRLWLSPPNGRPLLDAFAEIRQRGSWSKRWHLRPRSCGQREPRA